MRTTHTPALGRSIGRRTALKVRAYNTEQSTSADPLKFYKPKSSGSGNNGQADAPQDARKRDQRPLLSAIYPRGSVCAVVLGGGESDSRRLFPLTEKRTLPAIPLAGMYRLIDISLSNLLNSSINRVYVLTQYNSTSLNRYIQHSYSHGGSAMGMDAFIEVVAATQGPKEQRWAEGPADNVRQWWSMFSSNARERLIEDVLVLPSDQVYEMDFTHLVDFHRQSLADLTIVCRPVDEKLVDHVGCIKLGEGNRIQVFEEKPQGERKAMMSMDLSDVVEFFQESHLNTVPFLGMDGDSRTWIGSTGMYLFRKEAMAELLGGNPRARDFGREIIPDAIKRGMKVMAYNMPEYWVDVGGSVGEFYEFNMGLVQGTIPFSFEGNHTPFYGTSNSLPPTVYGSCKVSRSLVGSGCELNDAVIRGSVVGSRAIIGPGCTIEDSILMGADYFEAEKEWPRKVGPHYPHIGIGSNCTIRRAIVDKNARIGHNVQLINKEGVVESMDRVQQGIAVRDGVIVITKSAVVPDGTVV